MATTVYLVYQRSYGVDSVPTLIKAFSVQANADAFCVANNQATPQVGSPLFVWAAFTVDSGTGGSDAVSIPTSYPSSATPPVDDVPGM